jgi:penicillin-binding protein-related factor A (putative recombinase)
LTKTFVAKINPSSIICFLFLFETKVQNYLEKSKRLLTFAE